MLYNMVQSSVFKRKISTWKNVQIFWENLTKEEQIKELKKQLKRLEEEQRNIKETIELMEK